MLKIIFERVDGLQPWGTLLGEEYKPQEKEGDIESPKNTFRGGRVSERR